MQGSGRVVVVCWALDDPGPPGLECCCLRAAAREIGMKDSSQETLKPQALGNKAGWSKGELLLSQNI